VSRDRVHVHFLPSRVQALEDLARRLACPRSCSPGLAESSLLVVLQTPGLHPGFRTAALAEFGRRSTAGRYPAAAGLLGSAGIEAGNCPFADWWEFVDWAEQNRPDLEVKTWPAPLGSRPAGN
jgi:hypothetical protein